MTLPLLPASSDPGAKGRMQILHTKFPKRAPNPQKPEIKSEFGLLRLRVEGFGCEFGVQGCGMF